MDKQYENKASLQKKKDNRKAKGSNAIPLEDNRAAVQKKQVPSAKDMQEEEELKQKFPGKEEDTVQKKANDTGLPDRLKAGIEQLSGHSMDDVKVHYNSAEPAQLQAHAYAQGTDIHVAPGQEQHLPHEAWHVVQQKQGRVKPTKQLEQQVKVNDDRLLENEADQMGAKAANNHVMQRMTEKSRYEQRYPASFIPASVQKKQAGTTGKNTVLQPKSVYGSVVQRAIVSDLSYDSDNIVSLQDRAKLDQVKKYMDLSLSGIKSKIKTLYINVAEMRGANPADTKLNTPKTAIIVRIADWFVKISSVGDICGMLSHEIGVHTLADDRMTKEQKEEEKKYESEPFSVKVGLHTHTINKWPDKNSVRQQDHVNVSRDKGNDLQPLRYNAPPLVKYVKKKGQSEKKKKVIPSSNVSINARAQQYALTMLRIGDAINKDKLISREERDQRLHDLLNSFLFDYARMIATDDRAMRFLDKSALISQVYNWYKRVIIARHASAHTWLLRKNVQPTASNWGLRAYIAGKAARGIYHQLKPGGIPGTVMTGLEYLAGAPIGLGGFLMNRIGSGIGYLPPKLKSGVQTLGGGIVSTLRGIDYVTGEMENLVLPNLVNVGGWLKGGASALWNYKRK